MCNSMTFALRHTQISLSGILRHFRPPSRHLLLNTHDTNMEFLQLNGPLLDIFLFFSKTKIFHSHPCTGEVEIQATDTHWSRYCARGDGTCQEEGIAMDREWHTHAAMCRPSASWYFRLYMRCRFCFPPVSTTNQNCLHVTPCFKDLFIVPFCHW